MITNSFAKVRQVSQLSKHFTKKCNSIFTLRELMFAAHKYMFMHRELIFISCEQNLLRCENTLVTVTVICLEQTLSNMPSKEVYEEPFSPAANDGVEGLREKCSGEQSLIHIFFIETTSSYR